MEPIQHSHHTTRKRNSPKVNLTLSIVIHGLIFALGAYWAAHEGVLGKKLQELSVGLLPKEKKPEAKKEEAKTEEPKKAEEAKVVEQAKTAAPPAPKFVPPPAAASDTVAPPPAVTIPGGFVLDQAAITSSDPVIHYKQQMEKTLRSKWERPTDSPDLSFVAEVEVSIDAAGNLAAGTSTGGYNNKPAGRVGDSPAATFRLRGLKVEIGKPRRVYTIEPLEDPVPREEPEERPLERPAEPVEPESPAR